MSTFPLHLLFPLCSSILLVMGLLLVKRASSAGVGVWTATFTANQLAAIAFSCLWGLGGSGQSWTFLWQPLIVAALYILGQFCTFSAIQRGDVSVAAPIFGVKVLIVPCLLAWLGDSSLTASIWVGAILSTLGIALVQQAGGNKTGDRRHILLTVLFALCAASSFACFDLCVQHWSPAWGAGRLLPLSFWLVSLLSVGFLPVVQFRAIRPTGTGTLLCAGSGLIALQALCIVYTLGVFGDAARVNVVYSLRGLWGVIFAWAAARIWGGAEARLPSRVMVARLVGALLLTVAVVLIILYP